MYLFCPCSFIYVFDYSSVTCLSVCLSIYCHFFMYLFTYLGLLIRLSKCLIVCFKLLFHSRTKEKDESYTVGLNQASILLLFAQKLASSAESSKVFKLRK